MFYIKLQGLLSLQTEYHIIDTEYYIIDTEYPAIVS